MRHQIFIISLTIRTIVTTITEARPSYSFETINRYGFSHKHCYSSSTTKLMAKPKRGNVIDSYQTVSVNCSKCQQRLFRYKKKNGTKSNLIKCYVERIAEDSCGVLQKQIESGITHENYIDWKCPNCESQFARSANIKGLPALKLVGGKVRMTKK